MGQEGAFNMAGKLYVVGTPIGNLSDLSPRAVEVLSEADFIAAEDTRVTLKLLSRFDIKKPLVSYYEHNIRERGEQITQRILNGENCAVVSDAGMPCISDPGEGLVRLCYEQGIEVAVIPGPSAVVSALAISGKKTSRFCFEGFLSTAKKQRSEHLKQLENEERTMIFYEAPHKLKATLEDMQKVWGDRNISLCRELTKIHEEVIRTSFSKALEMYEQISPRGEYVLIIEGKQEEKAEEIAIEDALKLVRELVDSGEKLTEACKQISKKTGFSKSELYNACEKT